ncbi:DoxX family protein, partial [Bradyrhizobium sp. NBAIM08]|uniref:DoxX family protein n=1 Tax=Bradyrhizobium sp. NBAIM08 TaxID=2793815 RepID=UPI001CD39B02
MVPRSSVLGAILLTGYLGGAVATHARIGDSLWPGHVMPFLVATFLWLGLLLRDERVRAMLPLRKYPEPVSLLVSIPLALAGFVLALFVAILLQPGTYHIE